MFRFTIRDLFWLTLSVALGVGWAMTYRDLAEQRAFRSNLVGLYESPYGWTRAERIWVESKGKTPMDCQGCFSKFRYRGPIEKPLITPPGERKDQRK